MWILRASEIARVDVLVMQRKMLCGWSLQACMFSTPKICFICICKCSDPATLQQLWASQNSKSIFQTHPDLHFLLQVWAKHPTSPKHSAQSQDNQIAKTMLLAFHNCNVVAKQDCLNTACNYIPVLKLSLSCAGDEKTSR